MPPKKSQNKDSIREVATRVLTTLVLVPAVLLVVMAGGFYFKFLLIILTFLIAYEYARLTELQDKTRAIFTAGVFGIIWWLIAAVPAEGFIDGIKMAAIIGVTVIGVGFILKKTRMCWAGFGIAYIAIPIFALAFIGLQEMAAPWLIWMLAVVWGTDVGAYGVGKIVGGPKLIPAVSPNKTWAGLVGGVLVASATGAGVAIYFHLGDPFALALGGGLLALWAQLGDITESYIKRYFGAKDSGYLIPGHGGVLDRVDGLLFVAPVVALVLNYTA